MQLEEKTLKQTYRFRGPTDFVNILTRSGIEAVNLEYITRIREWPRNANGKKKQIFS